MGDASDMPAPPDVCMGPQVSDLGKNRPPTHNWPSARDIPNNALGNATHRGPARGPIPEQPCALWSDGGPSRELIDKCGMLATLGTLRAN